MERSLQYVGIDGEGAQRLALVLSQAADELGTTRGALTNLFADVGRTSNAPASIGVVEVWAATQATDIVRRTATIDVRTSHHVTAPEFHRDALSGFHLQGFAVVGLGYRHLGRETRTITDVWDCGAGVTSTVTASQQRSVYEIWVGVGYGPIAWGATDPRPVHDSWSTKKRTVTYARDGVPVTRPARTGPIETGACPK